jgi:hypothetical protein
VCSPLGNPKHPIVRKCAKRERERERGSHHLAQMFGFVGFFGFLKKTHI